MVETIKAGKEQLISYLAVIGTLGPLFGLVGTVAPAGLVGIPAHIRSLYRRWRGYTGTPYADGCERVPAQTSPPADNAQLIMPASQQRRDRDQQKTRQWVTLPLRAPMVGYR